MQLARTAKAQGSAARGEVAGELNTRPAMQAGKRDRLKLAPDAGIKDSILSGAEATVQTHRALWDWQRGDQRLHLMDVEAARNQRCVLQRHELRTGVGQGIQNDRLRSEVMLKRCPAPKAAVDGPLVGDIDDPDAGALKRSHDGVDAARVREQ